MLIKYHGFVSVFFVLGPVPILLQGLVGFYQLAHAWRNLHWHAGSKQDWQAVWSGQLKSHVVPGQSVLMPGQANVIPGLSLLMPGQANVIPGLTVCTEVWSCQRHTRTVCTNFRLRQRHTVLVSGIVNVIPRPSEWMNDDLKYAVKTFNTRIYMFTAQGRRKQHASSHTHTLRSTMG